MTARRALIRLWIGSKVRRKRGLVVEAIINILIRCGHYGRRRNRRRRRLCKRLAEGETIQEAEREEGRSDGQGDSRREGEADKH